MEGIRGKNIVLNGKVAAASEYRTGAAVPVYYEVIRVMKGNFLFLDDHLERLLLSCKKAKAECPDAESLKEGLRLLVSIEPMLDGNVKLQIYHRRANIESVCFFTPHFYPSESDYRTGVVTRSYKFERPDPNIKRWNETFRENVNRFIREERIYEAILLSDKGTLTEGSRSNLFFIDLNNKIITAPQHIILPGITRKYVLQICSELGLTIEERALDISEARSMQACFLSGTSPKVLPVCCLDQYSFDPIHPLVKELMVSFDRLIARNLEEKGSGTY